MTAFLRGLQFTLIPVPEFTICLPDLPGFATVSISTGTHDTHFCRIRYGGCAGRPVPCPHPPPITFKGLNYIYKLYINGKGIFQRLRFILYIDKIILTSRLYEQFSRNALQLLKNGLSEKNFKLLKYKHIIYHFKARDLEIPLI